MTTHSRAIKVIPGLPLGFQVRAVDGFDDGSWWWELFADDGTTLDFLDGGGWASDPYPTADKALDVGEYLIKQTLDYAMLTRPVTPWRAPDIRNFATGKMTDPRDVVHSTWINKSPSGRVTQLVNAGPSCINFYAIQPDGTGHARVVCLSEVPLWDRLYVVAALTKLGAEGADEEFVVDPVEMKSVLDESMRRSPPASINSDLAEINAHRRLIGMRPLDPAAAGWTDDDVRLEARRIRALNPAGLLRDAALSWG